METSNNFKNLKALFKETYSRNKKKNKATAELDASKNPEGFLKKNKNPSIKGKKGVAF